MPEPQATAIECPRCHQKAVIVERPVAQSCLPFPNMDALRCQACGHVGTRVVVSGREMITWGAPIR